MLASAGLSSYVAFDYAVRDFGMQTFQTDHIVGCNETKQKGF